VMEESWWGQPSSKGCPLCNKGNGVKICQKCWKAYTHDLWICEMKVCI
jgi:hypothetical protein